MAKIEILIVDDSPAFNHLTKLALQRSGLDCQIIDVSNGQRAIQYLADAEKYPDMILLDINMPVMDGFEFLEEYAKMKCAGTSIVYMLTSSSQDIDKLRAKAFGVVKDYFEKPLGVDSLAKIISDLGK